MKWLSDVPLIFLRRSNLNLAVNFDCRDELFNNIQKGVLKIPASLSEDCKNLIVSLLNRNPSKRLGAGPEGSEEIKTHPFFREINWLHVKDKKLSPPKPDINTKYY